MVLYRKYRPQIFKDLVGQKQIKESLLAALASGKISHGYLFAGPKGIGKTSTARIFAKAVNCTANRLTTNAKRKKGKGISRSALSVEHFSEPCNKCTSCLAIADGSHLDLVEIDAASNRGIDDVRDLREKIKLSPVSGRFKVYIIDEAHMLTVEAFNALLKTLEEPPEHVIFILCTTNAVKVPATILSRLTRFNFKRAGNDDIITAVQKVADAEKIKIASEAISGIARVSSGSFRDALSILDQLGVQNSKITKDDVRNLAFAPQEMLLLDFISSLAVSDLVKALILLEENVEREVDFSEFCKQVVLFLEKALLFKIGAQEAFVGLLTDAQAEQIQQISEAISFAHLQELMKLFLLAEGEIENYPLSHIPLILAACKYCGDVSAVSEVEEKGVVMAKNINKSATSKHEKRVDKTGKVKSMAQIETLWGDFLSRMKPVNAHLVAILRATKPAEFDGERLTLVTFYKFHKDKLEEPVIRTNIEKILEEVLGQKIHLKINLAEKWDRVPKVVSESNVVEVGSSDLASVASEIFSK